MTFTLRKLQRFFALPLAVLAAWSTASAFGADAPSDDQRAQAARQTAQRNAQCAAIKPFYWEIGTKSGYVAGDTTGTSGPRASTPMRIASASKLMFASYVVQRLDGRLTASDIKFLNFTSGYTDFKRCARRPTVHECLEYGENGEYTAANDGKFFYNGGHFEKYADNLGLGPDGNAALAAELQTQIGADVNISFVDPQPAGGIRTTPTDYALFLQKILSGQLLMRDFLGTHAVCASPAMCPGEAISSPLPGTESAHYSLGHWVESDGAFSSPGLFGFYPWIDSSKTYYGLVARESWKGMMAADPARRPAIQSAYCGKAIRKAWMTGVAQ